MSDGYGYGSGWGSTGWGGASTLGGTLLTETVTLGEGLDVYVPLYVTAAIPNNPYVVTVHFSHDLDPSYSLNFSALNYSTLPALTISHASAGLAPNQIRLHTSEQASTTYTLIVGNGRALPGDLLDPTRNTALFAGFPVAPTYFATAQSRSKVMLTFATAVLQDAVLLNTGSYTITDFGGVSYPVTSVTVNSAPGDALWVTLELGSDLDPGGYYVCTISHIIKALNGLTFSPLADVFQYVERDLAQAYTLDLSAFSGEVGNYYPDPRNLLSYPEDFSHPYWTKGGGTITAKATEGPLETRADSFVEDTATSRHELVKTGSMVGERITQSIYAKANGRSILTMRGNNPWGSAWFDLSTGELAGLSTNWVDAVGTVEPVEGLDGWYRCSLTRDTTAPGSTAATFGAAESTLSTSYEGSGVPALYLLGAQLVNASLLSEPLGQIFFSPALDNAVVMDSTIQIDSASVCTRAYDVYEIPSLPDPDALMIWGPDWPYNATVLNNTADVIWATADRLGLAHVNLTDRRSDAWAGAVDGPCDATLQETFDPTRVALLNVDDWVLYDGVGTAFICADNLTPIPAGPTTNINLQP